MSTGILSCTKHSQLTFPASARSKKNGITALTPWAFTIECMSEAVTLRWQRFLFCSVLKSPNHRVWVLSSTAPETNFRRRRWSIMSSADTRDSAIARGPFLVRSFATIAALEGNFCAASRYAIASSHCLWPVFQTFCLTSSPYLLKLFFFRKRWPQHLRLPFYKRDFALKCNTADNVVRLRVATLSVPYHCAHFSVTTKKKMCCLPPLVSHLRVLIFPKSVSASHSI